MITIETTISEHLKSKQLLATYLASLPDSPANPDGRYTKGLVSPLSPENSQTSFLADGAIEWLRNYKQDKPLTSRSRSYARFSR
jgi:hypothetical protein